MSSLERELEALGLSLLSYKEAETKGKSLMYAKSLNLLEGLGLIEVMGRLSSEMNHPNDFTFRLIEKGDECGSYTELEIDTPSNVLGYVLTKMFCVNKDDVICEFSHIDEEGKHFAFYGEVDKKLYN